MVPKTMIAPATSKRSKNIGDRRRDRRLLARFPEGGGDFLFLVAVVLPMLVSADGPFLLLLNHFLLLPHGRCGM